MFATDVLELDRNILHNVADEENMLIWHYVLYSTFCDFSNKVDENLNHPKNTKKHCLSKTSEAILFHNLSSK